MLTLTDKNNNNKITARLKDYSGVNEEVSFE